MTMRLDILLCSGAYLGLAFYRRVSSLALFLRGAAAIGAVLLLYAGFRYAVLDHVLPRGGGTFAHHIATRLEPQLLWSNTLKYCVYWAMGTNAFTFLLGALGTVFLYHKTRLVLLLVTWIAPFFVFFPFTGMAFSRLAAPSIPIIALLGMEFVVSIAKQRSILALCATLVLAQVTSAALYFPLVRIYPFKFIVDGRPIGDVPIGFLPTDHHHRQRAVTEDLAVAREVTEMRGVNTGIIGFGVMPYVYYLELAQDAVAKGEETCNGLVYMRYTAPSTDFFICNLVHNSHVKDPLNTFQACLVGKNARLHIIPRSRAATLGIRERSK
jgi:hypothetical protein